MTPDPALGYTAGEVRAAEQPLLDAGVPLMARAAAGLADALRLVLAERLASGRSRPDAGCILALVGSGNNGGDALYAVAELAAQGSAVTVVPLGRSIHEGGLATARDAGAQLLDASAVTPDHVAELARGCDVIVDGILGTGSVADPALRPPAREIVEALLPIVAGGGVRAASHGPAVVAVDLPSGVSADDGSVPPGPVLPATVTVTFGAMKAGLRLAPASQLAGRIRLVDIGLGPYLPVTPASAP